MGRVLAGGITNPVIEQITYLLFIKLLDDLHTVQEKKANRLNRPIENLAWPFSEIAKSNLRSSSPVGHSDHNQRLPPQSSQSAISGTAFVARLAGIKPAGKATDSESQALP